MNKRNQKPPSIVGLELLLLFLQYVPDGVIGIVTIPWTSMLTGFSIISGDPTRDWRLNAFIEPSLSLKLGRSTCAQALTPIQKTFCTRFLLGLSISLSIARFTFLLIRSEHLYCDGLGTSIRKFGYLGKLSLFRIQY